MIASEKGFVEIATALIEKGCDLNKQDYLGMTCFMWALGIFILVRACNSHLLLIYVLNKNDE